MRDYGSLLLSKAATGGADDFISPHRPFAAQGNLSAPLSAQFWRNKIPKRLYICDPELGTFWNFIRTAFLCVRIATVTATGPADSIRTYPHHRRLPKACQCSRLALASLILSNINCLTKAARRIAKSKAAAGLSRQGTTVHLSNLFICQK